MKLIFVKIIQTTNHAIKNTKTSYIVGEKCE